MSTGKLRVLFAQKKNMKQELELRVENGFRVYTGDLRKSLSPLSISVGPGGMGMGADKRSPRCGWFYTLCSLLLLPRRDDRTLQGLQPGVP